jgi:hypothetical protein
MINTTTINRIKRVTSLIAANAQATSPGPWYMSHGHVISPGKNKRGGTDFDVCSQPWDDKQHTVYGINAGMSGRNDMRHIATCDPVTMTKLVKDVTALLEERETVSGLATKLADLLGNLKPEQSIASGFYHCECHERMGNDFYFLPTGSCLRKDKTCTSPKGQSLE